MQPGKEMRASGGSGNSDSGNLVERDGQTKRTFEEREPRPLAYNNHPIRLGQRSRLVVGEPSRWIYRCRLESQFGRLWKKKSNVSKENE